MENAAHGGFCRIRDIAPGERDGEAAVTRLHMELLHFGPMAALGDRFIEELCYAVPLKEGLLKIALYEVDGAAAGFVAYTAQSITFHRSLLRDHWVYAGWVLVLSLLFSPRRLIRLPRAVRVVLSRRAEQETGEDPLAEVVCIAIRPQYLTRDFISRSGCRPPEELIAHAIADFRRAGLSRMRMIVDAENKAALFFYHRLGARFQAYEQAGESKMLVWFDLAAQPAGKPSEARMAGSAASQ